jgi:tetratricopeptide (TPR) repeat protein
MYARDYDGAVRRFRDVLEIEPAWNWAHSAIALARGLQGRFDEALAAVGRAMELAPDVAEVRLEAAWVLGSAGREAEARRALAGGIELGGSPVEAGMAHFPLGEIDGGLDWIMRGDWAIFDRIRRWDPRLDPVRTHPRFLELLGK